CVVASSTLPSRSWILFVVCDAFSSRRSTFVSSSESRRSIVSVTPMRCRSTSALRSDSWVLQSARSSRRVRASQTSAAARPTPRRRMRSTAAIEPTDGSGGIGRNDRGGPCRPDPWCLAVLALRVSFCSLVPLVLCHLLVLGGTVLGSALPLLRGALALHRRVACHVSGRLLSATEQLVK